MSYLSPQIHITHVRVYDNGIVIYIYMYLCIIYIAYIYHIIRDRTSSSWKLAYTDIFGGDKIQPIIMYMYFTQQVHRYEYILLHIKHAIYYCTRRLNVAWYACALYILF